MQQMGAKHWTVAHELCAACRANRSTLPWSDCRILARWRPAELMTLREFLEGFRQPLRPLVASHYVWRFFFYLDNMHVNDCNGANAIIYGNLFAEAVRDARPGTNQAARMNNINSRLAQWYDDHPGTHRLPALTLQNLVDSAGVYNLSGPAIKVANSRKASAFVAEFARELYPGDCDYDEAIRDVTSSLDRYNTLLDHSPMFMDSTTLVSLKAATLDIGVGMMRLRA